MDDTTTVIAAALEQVGPRLKRLRMQRGMTLTSLAAATGISKSTLSRLEAGQRRPSLEPLLPLAQAYHVPLDDLVGAPEVGDSRDYHRQHLRKAGVRDRVPRFYLLEQDCRRAQWVRWCSSARIRADARIDGLSTGELACNHRRSARAII